MKRVNGKTIEELIEFDPRYVMWMYEQSPGNPVTLEQYGAAIQALETEGPDYPDGCDLEGFVGGCARMGCHDD